MRMGWKTSAECPMSNTLMERLMPSPVVTHMVFTLGLSLGTNQQATLEPCTSIPDASGVPSAPGCPAKGCDETSTSDKPGMSTSYIPTHPPTCLPLWTLWLYNNTRVFCSDCTAYYRDRSLECKGRFFRGIC